MADLNVKLVSEYALSASPPATLGDDYLSVRATTAAAWKTYTSRYDAACEWLHMKAHDIKRRRSALEKSKKKLADKNGNPKITSTDKLKLNVGGSHVSVRRGTLTQFPETRLAALFSGRWDKRLLKDKNNRIFLDINPACFKKIVDYHNLIKIADPSNPPPAPQVAPEDEQVFSFLCNFFDLRGAFGQLSDQGEGTGPTASRPDQVDALQMRAVTDGLLHAELVGGPSVNEAEWETFYAKHKFPSSVIDSLKAEKEAIRDRSGNKAEVASTAATESKASLEKHNDEDQDGEWDPFSQLIGFPREVLEPLFVEREMLKSLEAQQSDLERKFEEEQAFIEFFVSGQTKDVVDLDVSGEKMTVKRSTLMFFKESALARQFDDAVWATHLQEEGECDSEDEGILIEHSSYCFGKIIDHLRLHAMVMPGMDPPLVPVVSDHQRDNFSRVVAFYYPGMADVFVNPCGSTIMSSSQIHQVNSWLPSGKRLDKPLYRASQDGWDAAIFHRHCDGSAETVSVVKTSSGGYIFGGYSDQSWSGQGYVNSTEGFLFSLLSASLPEPTKMPTTKPPHAIHRSPSLGPTFGNGHDLVIRLDGPARNNCNENPGCAYGRPPDTTGFLLSGNSTFGVNDVEVFCLAHD